MINFMRYRAFALVWGILLTALFVGGFVYKRMTRGEAFVYSVEFTGGTQVLYKFSQPISGEKVMAALEKGGITGAMTRDFSANEVLVRVKQFEGTSSGLAGRMREILAQNTGHEVEIRQVDSIGSGVGETLRFKSLLAFIIAVLLILIYIAMRFWSWGYAIGAIVALVHDIIFVMTVFLLFDIEISINVIGAIIAVLGYSVNDTIIISTRIRENMSRLSNMLPEDIVNISINETLRRTILTVFATTLVVVALVLFGGEVLRSLSLVLLLGFIFGTYSSIFVASPVMLLIDKRKK